MNRKSIKTKRQKTIIIGRAMKRLRCKVVMASLTYRVHGERKKTSYPSIDIYLN